MTEQDDATEGPLDEQALRDKARASEDLADQLEAAGSKEYGTVGPRYISPNQIVAFNVSYFRKAAGLTQEELGERLHGWTATPYNKAAVSAVERSWDGRRRQFDADLLFGLAAALNVPITAFFLPPEADGLKERYMLLSPHEPEGGRSGSWSAWSRPLDEYALYVMQDVTEAEEPAVKAYLSRMNGLRSMYFDGPLASEGYFEDLSTEEQLAERAIRLREQYEALAEIAGDIERSYNYVYDRLDVLRAEQDEQHPGLKQIRLDERAKRAEASLRDGARHVFGLHEQGKSSAEISTELNLPVDLVERLIKDGRALEVDDETP